MTVWKYVLQVADYQPITMPTGAEILHVDEQHGHLCLWARVSAEHDTEVRYFTVIGTGHIVPPNGAHVGSALMFGGDLVWHVFEVHVK